MKPATLADVAVDLRLDTTALKIIQKMAFDSEKFHGILITAIDVESSDVVHHVLETIESKGCLNWAVRNFCDLSLLEAALKRNEKTILQKFFKDFSVPEIRERIKDGGFTFIKAIAEKLDGYVDILSYNTIFKFSNERVEPWAKKLAYNFIIEHCNLAHFTEVLGGGIRHYGKLL